MAETRRRRRANAEGTVVHDRARNRWRGAVTIGWDDDGHQIRKWVTAPTKTEVLNRLRELQNAADHGQEPARRDLTLAKFLNQWLDDVLPGTVAPATETQYRDVVRLYIRPHLGQKRLRTLAARDVARMLHLLEAEGRSPNTRRLARSVLRRALRWAEHEGFVARNVAAIASGVRIGASEGRALTVAQARQLLAFLAGPVTTPTGRTVTVDQAAALVAELERITAGRHALTDEQVTERRVLHAFLAGHRLEGAFTVAVALGLRRGELLGLAWDDVDLDAAPARLTVRRALKRLRARAGEPSTLVLDDTKTTRSRRTVHLPAPVADALRTHRARQVAERLAAGPEWVEWPLDADLVFRTPFGTPVDPDNFRNLTYQVTDAAGLGRWSPHELRHSAASLLLAQGVPLKTISEVLGHSSIRVTSDVYAHLGEPAKAEAADAMEEALWGTP